LRVASKGASLFPSIPYVALTTLSHSSFGRNCHTTTFGVSRLSTSRANELGLKFHYVPELITLRRIHGANRSYRNEELRRDYLRTLKAALDRRRQQERD
jgi:hypothetical protein